MVNNGVLYTTEELDVLREYTGRDTVTRNKKTNNLSAYLGIKNAGNNDINSFLGNNVLPDFVRSGAELKSFLNDIEVLYGIACKYGSSHDIDRTTLY